MDASWGTRSVAWPLREITFVGMMIGSGKELTHFFNVTRSLRSALFVAGKLAAYARDRLRYGRAMRLTNGNALVGRLAKSAFDLGIEIRTSAPARALVFEDGRVAGVEIETPLGRQRLIAQRGVVLAAGGFPHDPERREGLYPHPVAGHFSPAAEGNTGDGIRLAESAGARCITGLPNPAAWVPVSLVPRRDGSFGRFPHFIDRAKPGVIAVTRHGRRFVNEANSYHDFIQAMLRACESDDEKAAWLITDHRTIRQYGLGHVKPFPVPIGPSLRSGYLKRGKSPVALAAATGIDAEGLADTLARYNRAAERGDDPQFGRGSTAYNRYLGDPNHTPNPCVAPITSGPYYAVKVVPGDLGSFAGLMTDARARVLGQDNVPIPGLYAAGNDMASVMGGNYPGGGITLGPAMTFGYIAGRDLAD